LSSLQGGWLFHPDEAKTGILKTLASGSHRGGKTTHSAQLDPRV
jgi:hypothetical protein